MTSDKGPRLSQRQFNILFWVAVGGMVLLLIAPLFGLAVNPSVLLIYGSLLAFVLKTNHDSKEGE